MEFEFTSEDIRLEMSATGRAVFQVKAKENLKGCLVQYYIGYSTQDKNRLYFSGYVDRCEVVDTGQVRIFCKELSGILESIWPVSLRHINLRTILDHYSKKTGLKFILHDKKYAQNLTPFFHTLGNGIGALDLFGQYFDIEDYMWLNQPDGSIYIGSHNDSRWATRPVSIDEKWFKRVFSTGAKTCPIVPALRPAAILNGRKILSIKLKKHEMEITCEKQ